MNQIPATAAIRSFFLWKDLDDTSMQRLLDGMQHCHVSSGTAIDTANGALCVLWSGKIKVYAKSALGERAALLRTMEAGAVFGVNQVFRSSVLPMSRLVACRPCDILCIPITLWETILSENPLTMQRYVRFLTERIEFLNQKICYLTAGTSERKLAVYLLSVLPKDGSFAALSLPAASLADLLDISRASLYRAINKLTDDGFLIHNDREYALRNHDKLIDFYA